MDPMTEIPSSSPLSFEAPAASTTAPTVQPRAATHPLIWAALVVWLSVEAIGDGLLALQTLLGSTTASRGKTPTVTPS